MINKKTKKHNIYNDKKSKKRKIKGGGARSALEKTIKEIKKTEVALIKQHKLYAIESGKFFKIYNTHISNLQKLDAFIPKLESFHQIFTDVVMPNDIKPHVNINMNNPLFLRAYNINAYSTPRDIAIEHVKQQVKYCMFKKFMPHDTNVITDLGIDFDEDMITLTFTINNFKKIIKAVPHIGYRLDYNSLIAAITTLLEEVKDNVEYDYKGKEFESKNSLIRIAPRHKTGKKQVPDFEIIGNSSEPLGIDEVNADSIDMDNVLKGLNLED